MRDQVLIRIRGLPPRIDPPHVNQAIMFFYAHSGIRYLVLLFGAAAVLFALAGLISRRPVPPKMQTVMTLFAASIHVQILAGMALLLTDRFAPALIGHIFLMLFAAAAAQTVSSVSRRKPPEERTWMPYLVGSVAAMVLIVAGIMAIGRPVLGSGM